MSRHAASLSPLLGAVTAAARKAAQAVLRDFREVEQLQVSLKGPADFVSGAAGRAGRILRAELARARPGYGFLAEADGDGGDGAGREAEHGWIVAPVGGALNFRHGLPCFAVSAALSWRGDPVCGVVYDPVRDELFYGEKGKGAYCNDKRMRVSARASLGDALVAASGGGRARPQRARSLCELAAVAGRAAGVRHSGCPALDLAYVAAGRLDGCWERGRRAGDIAAGVVLVREAGGIVSEPGGGADMLESGAVLAANPGLHRALAAALRQAADSLPGGGGPAPLPLPPRPG